MKIGTGVGFRCRARNSEPNQGTLTTAETGCCTGTSCSGQGRDGGGKVPRRIHAGRLMAKCRAGTRWRAHTGARAGVPEKLEISRGINAARRTPARRSSPPTVLKGDRTAEVVRVDLHQHGKVVMTGSVTGALPKGRPSGKNLPG